MGAYLSQPITEKVSNDAEHGGLVFGDSSMQGWRVSQEDAHNCIGSFDDKNTSFFAVYDGHGGAEVALYCSKYLPEFIKSLALYKEDNIEEALKHGFIAFDETLTKEDVIKELKALSDRDDAKSDNEECEEIEELQKEAEMPLDKLLARFQGDNLLRGGKLPQSPFLRAKKSTDIVSCSSGEPSGSKAPVEVGSSSNNEPTAEADSCSSSEPSGTKASHDGESCSSSGSSGSKASPESGSASGSGSSGRKASPESGSGSGNGSSGSTAPQEAGSCSGDGTSESKADTQTEGQKNGTDCTMEESEETSTKHKSPKKEAAVNNTEEKTDSSSECKPLTNGSLHDEDAEKAQEAKKEKKKVCKSTRILRQEYRKPVVMDDDDSSDDDSEDITFAVSGSDTESEVADEADEECEDEGEEDEECDEEDCGDEEECEGQCEGPGFHLKEQPGSDSGCTAVIAVLRDTKVIVANAGDSRCVVCREGKAVDMSHDHKPEDDPEFARITNAGGMVTNEGRVNGGLNLSRAIGDHAYKQNTNLSLQEQMISALPDIQSLELDWSKDEFMVLACDGIWNSMSSQEVVDFIGQRIHKNGAKMSKICEQLFDHCLADSTIGDGTGCDNMTCIIVKFPFTGEVEGQVSRSKRQASPPLNEGTEKKAKLDQCS